MPLTTIDLVRPPLMEDGSGERFTLGTLLSRQRPAGHIAIIGEPGSGKTMALRAATGLLGGLDGVWFADEPAREHVQVLSRSGVVIYAAEAPLGLPGERVLRLQRWGTDEFIEYLRPRGREVRARVLARLSGDAAFSRLEGIPVLCAAVLDELASGLFETDVLEVVERLCRAECEDPRGFGRACDAAGRLLVSFTGCGADAGATVRVISRGVLRLKPVRQWLAAKWVTGCIEVRGAGMDHVRTDVAPWLVDLVGGMLSRNAALCDRLAADFGDRKGLRPALAASLLHAAGRPVVPRRGSDLSTAFLPGVNLSACDLQRVGLAHAVLSGARLDGANLRESSLCEARLDRASLRSADLTQARLLGASLRGADLRCARIDGADLCRACLSNAALDGISGAGAEFVQADLSGASLLRARLRSARFVDCDVERANFSSALMPKAIFRRTPLGGAAFVLCDMTEAVVDGCAMSGVSLDGCACDAISFKGCDLYASRMRRTTLRRASFVSCGLAQVDWQGADLSEAKFVRCTFHAGSSRSGLVGSVIASEGTRTGFYTDEFSTRDQRPPEEIRTANLCECDLRGAEIGNLDFYLVDLRGAIYTPWQAAWLRKCGAILGRL